MDDDRMPSLNLDIDYFEHPKTKRLIGLLGRGSEVLPIRLWCYCGKYHAETGTLSDHSAREIESLIGWWGKESLAVDALVKVGFLEPVEGGFQVHQWLEHEGHLWAFKVRGRKAAVAKWAKLAGVDASSMPQACNKDASSNAPSLPSIPTLISDEDEGGARTFARNWVSVNCPRYLKGGKLATFERLILQLGKDTAAARVQAALAAGKTSDPFAYVETCVVNEQAKVAVAAKAAKPVKNWQEGVRPDGQKPRLTSPPKTVG